MANANFEQSNFTRGEIDPLTAARTDIEQYYKSLKTARNVLVLPQGGASNRWGTTFVTECTITGANDPTQCEMSVLIYDNNSTYLMVWEHNNVNIFFQNILIATVATTYPREIVKNLRFSQVQNRTIITHPNFPPAGLVRRANAANVITGFSAPNNTLILTNNLVNDTILPVTFTTNNTLPTTTPQIYSGITYYAKVSLLNQIALYTTPQDATNGVNQYAITNAGVGVNTAFIQNTWALASLAFKFVPSFDYNGGYSGAGFTFTPSAVGTIGQTGVIITASGAIFNAAFIGGLFTGNSGILRITGFTDATHITGTIVEPFANTNAIPGNTCLLAEPAWSATRGYPAHSTFAQQRVVFAGSLSNPDGVWLSTINDALDFDDSETLDDNAISWYPASGGSPYIVGVTSGRTLLTHTLTGTYSTPILSEVPFTPRVFTLTKQNELGVSPIQPVFVDNQVYFVDSSGNNVISMIQETIQSNFTSDNKSIWSGNLINQPVDMASFSQPKYADGFFVLFVNQDGNLCVHQTLSEQGVAGWTLQNTLNKLWQGPTLEDVGAFPANYIRVVTADTRCWFTVQRGKYVAQAATQITGFDGVANTLTAVGHGIPIGRGTLANFTTAGVLPQTNPQITLNHPVWVRAIDVDTFAVYAIESDADNDINRYTILDFGINSFIVPMFFVSTLFVEELDFTVNTDCTFNYRFDVPTNVITGLQLFNGQQVTVKGDGYVLNKQIVLNGEITTERAISNIYVGVGFQCLVVPLPVTVPGAAGILYKAKTIRSLYINYFESLGFQVDGYTLPGQEVLPGVLPVPISDVANIAPLRGWDQFETSIQITQDLPLPMTILALSYVLEV